MAMKMVKKKISLVIKWIKEHPMSYIMMAILIYLIYNITVFIKVVF